MAKERVISHTVESNVIRFAVKGVSEVLELGIGQLSESILNHARIHGLVQKVSDAAALEKGASPAAKYAAMAEVVAQLIRGEWNRKATRQPAFNVGDVVLALARTKTGGDVDKANRAIDAYAAKHGLGREEAAKLFRQDATVGAEYDRIVRERKPVAFNADEALAEFGGEEPGETGEETDEEVIEATMPA